MMKRYSRSCGCLLTVGLTACFLFIIITYEKSSASEETETIWLKRHLTKGEPSGEDARNTQKTLISNIPYKNSTISRLLPDESENSNESTFFRRLDLYKERKRVILNTCRKYGLGKLKSEPVDDSKYQKMEMNFPWPPEKSLMYQDTWNLLYCWIHKVASSSWSKVFFSLKGQEVPASRLHEAAQKFSLSSSNTDLRTSIRNSLVFTIVRHPFERLVSAYRDKFELAKKYAYVYSHYANKILNLSSPLQVAKHRRPTFSEFVDYLLSVHVTQFNDHWVPYWLHCHVCEMEYDIIGKMETITEDMEFIAKESGLAAANISLPWANKKSSGDNVSLDYFRKLSVKQVQGLYNIYKPDFEMFGYNADSYFKLFGTQAP